MIHTNESENNSYECALLFITLNSCPSDRSIGLSVDCSLSLILALALAHTYTLFWHPFFIRGGWQIYLLDTRTDHRPPYKQLKWLRTRKIGCALPMVPLIRIFFAMLTIATFVNCYYYYYHLLLLFFGSFVRLFLCLFCFQIWNCTTRSQVYLFCAVIKHGIRWILKSLKAGAHEIYTYT